MGPEKVLTTVNYIFRWDLVKILKRQTDMCGVEKASWETRVGANWD